MIRPEIEVKMGPSEDRKSFNLVAECKDPMPMEHIACMLFECFVTHCVRIGVDPQVIIDKMAEDSEKPEVLN